MWDMRCIQGKAVSWKGETPEGWWRELRQMIRNERPQGLDNEDIRIDSPREPVTKRRTDEKG